MAYVKYLQKLGKALMLPVSCLPVCGLLMGLGYCLCPAAMQGGEMSGFAAQLGFSSLAYFCNVYRQYFGHSPRD